MRRRSLGRVQVVKDDNLVIIRCLLYPSFRWVVKVLLSAFNQVIGPFITLNVDMESTSAVVLWSG